MNPRSASTNSDKADVRTSPFEQITALENEQDARVQHALEQFEAEEREAVKTMNNAEKTQEEQMREEAREELREYAKKEPAAILSKSEEEAKQEVSTLAKKFDVQHEKTVDSLMESILNTGFLSM